MKILGNLFKKKSLNIDRPLPDDYLTQDDVDSDFRIFGEDLPYLKIRFYDYWDGKGVIFFETLYSRWHEAAYITPKEDGGFILETIPHKAYLKDSINARPVESQIYLRLDTTNRKNNYYEVCRKVITMSGVKWVPRRIIEGYFTSRVRTNIYA